MAFLIVGRLMSVVYLGIYAIPINFVILNQSVKNLEYGQEYLIDSCVTIGILIVNVTLYLYEFFKQRRLNANK